MVLKNTASPHRNGQHFQIQGKFRKELLVLNQDEKSLGGSGEKSEVKV